MNASPLEEFIQLVKSDTDLQEQLKTAQDPSAVAEIARSVGLSIATEDLEELRISVSDEELEADAGKLNALGYYRADTITVCECCNTG